MGSSEQWKLIISQEYAQYQNSDDVFKENLDFFLEDRAFDNQKDAVIINSKGFGGNNATTSVISENLTMSLLEQRYSKSDIAEWQKKESKF